MIIIGGVIAAVLLFTCVCGVGAVALIASQGSNECSVGQAGYNVSMTVTGSGASKSCQTLTSGSWISLSSKPKNAVVCTGKVEGKQVEVRDTGMQILGGTMCLAITSGSTFAQLR